VNIAQPAPTVSEIPACDLEKGMRLEWGAPWQPPVFSVTTWGPGEDEAPSRPETWWTRVTVQYADRSLVSHYYTPSAPVRVVGDVACHECGTLTAVTEAAMGRLFDRTARPPRFVEQFDLCPTCAATPIGA
jgi:hypothetical protein